MMMCKSLNNGNVGTVIFHYREVVLFQRLFCTVYIATMVNLDCPLNGDLSSFGVSFIRGSTVSNNK